MLFHLPVLMPDSVIPFIPGENQTYKIEDLQVIIKVTRKNIVLKRRVFIYFGLINFS